MSGLSIHDNTYVGKGGSPSKFNNPSTYSTVYDDRVISGTGAYDLTMTRSEFDIEEDFDEVVEAKENKQELNEVMKNYQRILSGIIEDVQDESVSYQQLPKKQEIVQKQKENREVLVGNNKTVI